MLNESLAELCIQKSTKIAVEYLFSYICTQEIGKFKNYDKRKY